MRALAESQQEHGLHRKEGHAQGVRDTPNEHDILTGTQPDGRAHTTPPTTRAELTSNASTGRAQLGHSTAGQPNAS
jgi:hypothetical protein